MRAEQQIGARADRFPHLARIGLAAIQGLERGLAAVIYGIGPGRIELDRRKPLVHVFRRALGRHIAVVIDVGGVVGFRIQVGIRAQAFVDAPAEQFVHGLVDSLADNIPAGHLDPAEHADERDIRSL